MSDKQDKADKAIDNVKDVGEGLLKAGAGAAKLGVAAVTGVGKGLFALGKATVGGIKAISKKKAIEQPSPADGDPVESAPEETPPEG